MDIRGAGIAEESRHLRHGHVIVDRAGTEADPNHGDDERKGERQPSDPEQSSRTP